jgi:hypothetical protein
VGTLIGDCDKCLFDSVAQEVNKLAGTTAIIYQFEEMESTRDPLWDEEVTTVYKKNDQGTIGIECPVYFKAPDRSSLTGEEGLRLDKTSEVWIAKADMDERGIRRLRPGDIVFLWNTQYYDVTESHASEGYINDNPQYSMVRFDLVRRTKGLPEGMWLRDQV